jgi:hypothetical protein
MVFELHSLLDLRRDAESSAKLSLELAAAKLSKEEEEQARLASRWQSACAARDGEKRRLAAGPAPSTAAQGLAREGYLSRLRAEVDRHSAIADEHRATVLAAEQASHRKALRHYEEAARDREAVSKLEERARAAAAAMAARKAEDAATDLANATRRR